MGCVGRGEFIYQTPLEVVGVMNDVLKPYRVRIVLGC
jgi:hypothetical protein